MIYSGCLFQVCILGCTISSAQPSGFQLLSPVYGCPVYPGIQWDTASILLHFQVATVDWSSQLHLLGPFTNRSVQWNMCRAQVDGTTEDSSQLFAWSQGDYCILEDKGCPSGKWNTIIIDE